MAEANRAPDPAVFVLALLWLAVQGLALLAQAVAIHGAALVLVLAGWGPPRPPAPAVVAQPIPTASPQVEHHPLPPAKPAPRRRRRTPARHGARTLTDARNLAYALAVTLDRTSASSRANAYLAHALADALALVPAAGPTAPPTSDP
jgi:hypothetical protein